MFDPVKNSGVKALSDAYFGLWKEKTFPTLLVHLFIIFVLLIVSNFTLLSDTNQMWPNLLSELLGVLLETLLVVGLISVLQQRSERKRMKKIRRLIYLDLCTAKHDFIKEIMKLVELGNFDSIEISISIQIKEYSNRLRQVLDNYSFAHSDSTIKLILGMIDDAYSIEERFLNKEIANNVLINAFLEVIIEQAFDDHYRTKDVHKIIATVEAFYKDQLPANIVLYINAVRDFWKSYDG